MARNIYGSNNNIKCNITLNLVASYISWREPNTKGFFHTAHAKEQTPDDGFVGLFHTVSGEGTLRIRDKDVAVKSDELVFVRYRDLNALITKESEWHFFCLWFYASNVSLEFGRVFNLPIFDDEYDTMEKIAYLLNDNYYSVGQANGLGIKLLCEILGKIDDRIYDKPYLEIIRNTVFFINQNVQNTLSIKELAAKCCLSEKHFRNLFTEYMGMPPKQYVIKTKLEKASFLLAFSDQSVSMISDELSFLDLAYFIKRFKLYFGCTPTEYRKRGRTDAISKNSEKQ